jgi:hypothetical protein
LQGSKPVADYRGGVFRGPELKKLSGGKVKILADPKDTIDVAELTRMSEERCLNFARRLDLISFHS